MMMKMDKGDLKVVLSTTGHRYHQFSCGWSRNIKRENRKILPESELPENSIPCKICGGSNRKQTVFG